MSIADEIVLQIKHANVVEVDGHYIDSYSFEDGALKLMWVEDLSGFEINIPKEELKKAFKTPSGYRTIDERGILVLIRTYMTVPTWK
jgi:hypothetical protein